MSELKPCQCGADAADIWTHWYPEQMRLTGVFYQGHCLACTRHGPAGATKEEAIEKWNHRPVEDQLRAELEAARAELKTLRTELDMVTTLGWQCLDARDAAQAELAAERGRLDRLLQECVMPIRLLGGEHEGKHILVVPDSAYEIPAGQTARDVIDRLRQKGGDQAPPP